MVKSNKLFKVLVVVLAILAIFSFISTVQAADLAINPTEITAQQPTNAGNAPQKIKDVTKNILWIVQAVGIAAGVIIIAYMGVKYITSSPDGKAEFKKQAYVYVLGAGFLILAPTIANAVFTLINS